MIRALRKRHRRMMLVLGAFLPIAFMAGMAARKPIPSVTLPEELAGVTKKFPVVKSSEYSLFARMQIEVQIRRESANAGGYAVQLTSGEEIVKPDVLVYWLPGNSSVPSSADAAKLPANALLLGAFNSPVTLPLPANTTAGEGALMLYSLADQNVVAVSKPFTLEKK